MERHGPDGREGGLLGGDARGNSGDHVAGDEVVLGVGGIATAGTGHERPDGMLAGTVFLHDARAAVAEWLGRLEPRANGTLGLPDSVPPDLLEDLADQIRASRRLSHEREGGELGGGPLRARAHQRGARTNEHVSGSRRWTRHLLQSGRATPFTDHGLHVVPPIASPLGLQSRFDRWLRTTVGAEDRPRRPT